MAIKIVQEMSKPEVNERLEILKQDIREIIDNRIELCEIVDAPYPRSTLREHVLRAIYSVIYERTIKAGWSYLPDKFQLFSVHMKKKDGEYHCFILFDVQRWESELEKANGERQEQKEEGTDD